MFCRQRIVLVDCLSTVFITCIYIYAIIIIMITLQPLLMVV